jgi:hypothetical protein
VLKQNWFEKPFCGICKKCPEKNKMIPKDVQNVILDFHRQKLPKCIEDIILEYHDKYNTIDNTKRINFVIESGYRNWLRTKNCYSSYSQFNSQEREYLRKMSLWLPNPFYFFSWVGLEQFFPLASEWRIFMQNFLKVDREFYRRKLNISQLDLII